ncbi:MAG: recombinase family protein [Candidatus Xenobiia bacterium LiM19]
MPFAAIYARVSSELQDVDVSIGAQETELRARAKHDGYTIYEVFSDPAESGRLSDRPAFQRMMAVSKQNPPPFTRIYLWDLRRFGRDRIESAVFKKRLRSRGIQIVYLKENIDDSTTGRLIEGIMEALAEYESFNIAEDTRRGQREITRRGYYHGGEAPFGFRVKAIMEGGRERKRLEPDPDKSCIIRDMYEKKLKGESPGAIARALNRKGIKSPRGGLWSAPCIEHILKAPIYIGRLEYGRQQLTIAEGKRIRLNRDKEQWTICEDACEAIIDKALWEEVQIIMKARSRGRNHQAGKQVYLLSGILTCSRCGGALIGQAKRRKDQHTRYYYCRTRKGTGACVGAVVRADELEELVLETMKEKLSEMNTSELANQVMEEQESNSRYREIEQNAIKKDIASVERKISNLMAALEEGLRPQEINERLSVLGRKKEGLLVQLRDSEKKRRLDHDLEHEALALMLEDIGYFLEKDRNTPEELQSFLATCIRVEFDTEKKTGTIYFSLPVKGENPCSIATSYDSGFLNKNRGERI